jgi:hypothetical protein
MDWCFNKLRKYAIFTFVQGLCSDDCLFYFQNTKKAAFYWEYGLYFAVLNYKMTKRKSFKSLVIAYFLQLAVLMAIGIYGISAVRSLERKFDNLFSRKLIPAMDISRMLELQFQNRFHLEEYLTGLSLDDQVALLNEMHQNNRSIDSLVDVYLSGISNMDKEETEDLKEFQRAHHNYRKEENYIVNLHGSGNDSLAFARFKMEASIKFQQAVTPMKKFEQVEIRLGKAILEEVKAQAHFISWILFSAMIGAVLLAIWIGLKVSRQYMEN